MFEVRNDIKNVLRLLGKKSSDLSRELGINYDVLNGYLNGRRKTPSEVLGKIEAVLAAWGDV